jgi:hypothetical protein
VLDERRAVEVRPDERSPLSEQLRTAEALGVRLETVPFDQQQVDLWTLDPAEDANRAEAGGLRDHLARRDQRVLELALLPGNDAHQRALQNHAASSPRLMPDSRR